MASKLFIILESTSVGLLLKCGGVSNSQYFDCKFLS